MDEEPKSPWESKTIQAAIKGAVATALAIAIRVGGQTYDVAFLRDLSGMGTDLILQLLSLWWYWKAAAGRMNATQPIAKKEKP